MLAHDSDSKEGKDRGVRSERRWAFGLKVGHPFVIQGTEKLSKDFWRFKQLLEEKPSHFKQRCTK